MQHDFKQIKQAGIQVVGISYDSIEVLKTFSDREEIAFPLLSDPDSATITAYSLKNQEMAGKKFRNIDLDGVPYPGTLLVDQAGVVRDKLFIEGYKDRHSVANLLDAVKKMDAGKQTAP